MQCIVNLKNQASIRKTANNEDHLINIIII
jgi:hypothetical protein